MAHVYASCNISVQSTLYSLCQKERTFVPRCNYIVVEGGYCTGFPTAWKIMENLENEKCFFQTWKNHGI